MTTRYFFYPHSGRWALAEVYQDAKGRFCALFTGTELEEDLESIPADWIEIPAPTKAPPKDDFAGKVWARCTVCEWSEGFADAEEARLGKMAHMEEAHGARPGWKPARRATQPR